MNLQEMLFGYPLELCARWVGRELTVLCSGGSRPHVGGCAMAIPYNRSHGEAAAVSTLSAPGHQDAVLAGAMAKRLCKRFGQTVFVQCGIHYDHLTPEALARLQDSVLALCDRLEAPI